MKNLVVRAAGAVLLALIAAGCSAVSAGANASPSLDGSAWVLSDLPGKALVPQSSSTLQFAAGRASGSDSCNRFAGAYTLGMFTRRANSPGVAIGIGFSIVLTLIAWHFKLVHPYFYLAISILLCIVFGYIGSLFFIES